MSFRLLHRIASRPGFVFLSMLAMMVAAGGSAHAELVCYWAGNGNALDSAGTNNGTLTNGATYSAGTVGQAFSLDGSDDYVALPNATSNLVKNESGTITAWVKPSAVGGNDIVVAFGSNVDGQGIGLGIFNNWGGIRIYHHTGAYDWQTSTPVAANVWSFLAYTWDSTTETVYVNGEYKESRLRGSYFSYVPGYARIGDGFWGDPANLFPGLIDEVRVYNTALSGSEIAALVPEPSTLLLGITGMLGMMSWFGMQRKRRLAD